MPLFLDRMDAAVDEVLARLPGDIVLGTPLGIGKPNPFINRLYQRIKATPARRLKIITALSLQKPVGGSEIERHFLAPFVERVFGDYPDLDYVLDLRAGKLPANVEVLEFFLKTGDYLGNAEAQQSYICTNYTFVARDMALHGVNLLAQAVSVHGDGESMRLSLSSNPDLTFEVLERLRAAGENKVLTVAVLNQHLPFMPRQAEVAPDFFDLVVTDAVGTHALFAPPNMKVSVQDYAIGLHASSLISDGGTLQIGIGALGDAIAQALILREQHNDAYRRLLATLSRGQLGERHLGEFEQGLYGCSEMFVNGLLRLIEAGVVKREVYDDAVLQRLLNHGHISQVVSGHTLRRLHEAGRIGNSLSAGDVAFLVHFGIFKPGVQWRDEQLHHEGRVFSARLDDADAFLHIERALLGERLRGGVCLHGGFFLGPNDFYQRLRQMSEQELDRIEMHRIDFINQLDVQHALASVQRQRACFMNTTMMVTLLGAAVSDGLENGQLVSGVGGQYNFVAMAHALPCARSILMLRTTRESRGKVSSNIVWNYGHTTIPRHLRDMVVTEYGVADLRGQSDAEVIKRLLAVADSRFQDELMETAKANGKLEQSYQLPDAVRRNLPEVLAAGMVPWQQAYLPDFPFGTDFTAEELAIIEALQRMRQASENPLELVAAALKGLFTDKEAPPAWLARLGLDEASDLKNLLLRKLFVGNL
ncbi:acetyl-CoA hydrolase [Chitinimonas prasina]|uniref:Acetyl-CoA hydrolase n=1 Tax=Chitinimonas prasina TaxID=1434937 RepID=A0ABQ5YHT0_9NEIS|nr:acetyl-CoA hydrolase/transferase C-terminal domain-containing protein [Chitinimonas prasina]GLR13212.1 acetyl-CoA hydrolase [Chitinimonas prasina]